MASSKRVCIGIHVYAEPRRLYATLDSLRIHTSQVIDVLLLPDGPDAATRHALAALRHVPQSGTTEPLGAPACFNRLAMRSTTPVVVLLESGALVGPGWLDYLLAALDADPGHGLAGPSTNRAWNEQRVFPLGDDSLAEVVRTAHQAARGFGTTWRTLAPLYSLSDFCYVVQREVIAAIGGADEQYGLGPCWEMDYNIRATRAGFAGVWACGAYVHRSPVPTRRLQDETRFFAVNRNRYQAKFCRLQLESTRQDYATHCEGETCPHFAPKALIQLHLPLLTTSALPPPPSVNASIPLISCIMPTYNCRAFVPQAVHYFLRQDYTSRELIIVDDGTDPVRDLIPDDSRLRYVRLDHRSTIGAKRNLACTEARGEIIVHWADDDWMAPWRLRYQVEHLLQQQADICGLDKVFFYDPATERSWQYVYPMGHQPWVASATLCYTKAFWQHNPFPDLHLGEDARFVWDNRPKRLVALPDNTFYVAVMHPGNVSPKQTTDCRWQPYSTEAIHHLLGGDAPFYGALRLEQRRGASSQPPTTSQAASFDAPRVSCIMPTHNRRNFVPQAITYFMRQDYPNRELIIVDDGTDPISDLLPTEPRLQYLRLPQQVSIGAKRNLACETATGEIIVCWDDDDWYASHRLSYQVAPLLAGAADVTGLDRGFLLSLPTRQFWAYTSQLHAHMFVQEVIGGTLAFWKRFWGQGTGFPDLSLAEDAKFLQGLLRRGTRLSKLANAGTFVYVRHNSNSWRFTPGTFLDRNGWQQVEPPAFMPEADLAFYGFCPYAVRVT